MQTTLSQATEQARAIIAANGYTLPAIVTESRLTKTARRTFFGFRFDPSRQLRAGDEITDPDGMFSIVRAVVEPA